METPLNTVPSSNTSNAGLLKIVTSKYAKRDAPSRAHPVIKNKNLINFTRLYVTKPLFSATHQAARANKQFPVFVVDSKIFVMLQSFQETAAHIQSGLIHAVD